MDDYWELINVHDGFAIVGVKPSTGWNKVKAGELPKPIKIGPNTSKLVKGQMRRIRDALIAQKDAEQIRALVVKLEAERLALGAEVTS